MRPPRSGAQAKAPANHSPAFFVDESSLALGMRSLAGIAVDWLTEQPKLGKG
jgi:hypothetical protein